MKNKGIRASHLELKQVLNFMVYLKNFKCGVVNIEYIRL